MFDDNNEMTNIEHYGTFETSCGEITVKFQFHIHFKYFYVPKAELQGEKIRRTTTKKTLQ